MKLTTIPTLVLGFVALLTSQHVSADIVGFNQRNGSTSEVYSYQSAEDLATNTNANWIGNTGSDLFDSIAADAEFFYGWTQGGRSIYRFDSLVDLATNTNRTFVGGSGSGKSVLMRSILGLIKKEKGQIELLGVDYDSISAAEKLEVDRSLGAKRN